MRLCRALTVKLELKTAMLFTQLWHTKMQKEYSRLLQGKRLNLAGMTWRKQDSEFIWHR